MLKSYASKINYVERLHPNSSRIQKRKFQLANTSSETTIRPLVFSWCAKVLCLLIELLVVHTFERAGQTNRVQFGIVGIAFVQPNQLVRISILILDFMVSSCLPMPRALLRAGDGAGVPPTRVR
jgi:hypothetical protein